MAETIDEPAYQVMRAHGTDVHFCGVFHDKPQKGIYLCAGCNLPLFRSDAKLIQERVAEFFSACGRREHWKDTDVSYGMKRQKFLHSFAILIGITFR